MGNNNGEGNRDLILQSAKTLKRRPCPSLLASSQNFNFFPTFRLPDKALLPLPTTNYFITLAGSFISSVLSCSRLGLYQIKHLEIEENEREVQRVTSNFSNFSTAREIASKVRCCCGSEARVSQPAPIIQPSSFSNKSIQKITHPETTDLHQKVTKKSQTLNLDSVQSDDCIGRVIILDKRIDLRRVSIDQNSPNHLGYPHHIEYQLIEEDT